MQRICGNCKYFVVTGAGFDKKTKSTSKCGFCHRPGGSAKKVRGKLVGGEPVWEEDSCKHFRKQPAKNKKKKR